MDEEEWAAIADEGYDLTDIEVVVAVIVADARIKDVLHRARPPKLESVQSPVIGGV